MKFGQPDWGPNSYSLAFGAELSLQRLQLHLILNAYWEPLDFELPPAGDGDWRRWIDTALEPPHEIVEWQAAPPVSAGTYQAGARSVVVLFANSGSDPGR